MHADEGIAYIKETMKMDPTFAWTHSHISFLYRMKGDHATSVDERARADELLDMSENAQRLRGSFATGGWTAYLRELVSQDWGSLGSRKHDGPVCSQTLEKRKKPSPFSTTVRPEVISGSFR
jgi:hypothetical protein